MEIDSQYLDKFATFPKWLYRLNNVLKLQRNRLKGVTILNNDFITFSFICSNTCSHLSNYSAKYCIIIDSIPKSSIERLLLAVGKKRTGMLAACKEILQYGSCLQLPTIKIQRMLIRFARITIERETCVKLSIEHWAIAPWFQYP